MAKVRKRTTGTYRLELNENEIDVLYRLLKATKKNEENSRLSIVNDILGVVYTEYATSLTFEENEKLSSDHFGVITFSHSPAVSNG